MALALRVDPADGAPERLLKPAPGRPAVITVRHGSDTDGRISMACDGEALRITNHSRMRLLVNDAETTDAVIRPGDRVVVGRMLMTVIEISAEDAGTAVVAASAPEPPGPAPIPSSAVSDRQRKRISASKLAALDPKPAGFMKRMTSAITNRADAKRLEELDAERNELLREAGRLSLSDRLGLSPRAVAAVIAGAQVHLGPADVNRAVLDRWRQLRTRVVELDTEISAIRQGLGLGPDPGTVLALPQGPRARQAVQERTFETMDRTETEELSGLTEVEPPPPGPATRGRR
jgi:hypothetical protein